MISVIHLSVAVRCCCTLALSWANNVAQTAGNVTPNIINNIKSAWHLNAACIQSLCGMNIMRRIQDALMVGRIKANASILRPPPRSLTHLFVVPFNWKPHRYSRRTSWSQASSQRGLWAWSRQVCSRAGPSRPPPGRGRKRTLPLLVAGWCHPSSTWLPRCTAPCGPGPRLCWREWSPGSAWRNKSAG